MESDEKIGFPLKDRQLKPDLNKKLAYFESILTYSQLNLCIFEKNLIRVRFLIKISIKSWKITTKCQNPFKMVEIESKVSYFFDLF